MVSSTIYIDADFLLAHQEETELGQYARNQIGTCENMKNNHGYDLRTPMMALGEAASKCCFEGFTADELTKLIEEKGIDTPVPSKDEYEMAIELINKAGIESCDALLAAHAMLDSSAEILLTTDGRLQGSRYIKRKIKELKRNNLKIRDYVKKRT